MFGVYTGRAPPVVTYQKLRKVLGKRIEQLECPEQTEIISGPFIFQLLHAISSSFACGASLARLSVPVGKNISMAYPRNHEQQIARGKKETALHPRSSHEIQVFPPTPKNGLEVSCVESPKEVRTEEQIVGIVQSISSNPPKKVTEVCRCVCVCVP